MSLKLPRNWDFGLKMDRSKIVRSQSMMAVDPKGSGNWAHHPPSLQERPLKAGWLKKQRSIVKNWQQRYFVLKGQCLSYYKEEDDPKPQGLVQLHGSTIKEVAAAPDEGGKFIFEIIPRISGEQNRSGQDSYVLMASSQADMEEWVRLLRRAVGSPLGVVFGQQLAETMAYEQRFGQYQVPILVEKCAEFIRKHGLNEEGIFRLPGQDNLVKQLRDAFDAGERPSFDQDTDVHTVASLLKLYLRELPEPVIPCAQYEDFLLCGQLLTADEAKGHQQLVKQLALLPRDNCNLLSYICRFLHEIQQNSITNKMSVENLATVFGVNLIKPKMEDPVTIMKGTHHIQKVMTVMISQHTKLFPALKEVVPSPRLQKSHSKKSSVPRSAVGWDAVQAPWTSRTVDRTIWEAKDDAEPASSKHASRTDPSAGDNGEIPLQDAPGGWAAQSRKRTQTLPNRTCFLNIPPNIGNQSMDGEDVSSPGLCSSSSSSSVVHPNPVSSVSGHKRTSSCGLSRLLNFPQTSNSDHSQSAVEERKKETPPRESPSPQLSGHLGKSFQTSETPSPKLNGGTAPYPPAEGKGSPLEDPDSLQKTIVQLRKSLESQKNDYERQIKSLQEENFEVWTKVVRLNEELEKEKKKFAELEVKLESIRHFKEDSEKMNHLLEDSLKSVCRFARKTEEKEKVSLPECKLTRPIPKKDDFSSTVA
nr:rho GTPase-activating protein 25 isoform X2 [Pogona vitticeps]